MNVDVGAVAYHGNAGQDGIGVMVRSFCDQDLLPHPQAAHRQSTHSFFAGIRRVRMLPARASYGAQPFRPPLDICKKVVDDFGRRNTFPLESQAVAKARHRF